MIIYTTVLIEKHFEYPQKLANVATLKPPALLLLNTLWVRESAVTSDTLRNVHNALSSHHPKRLV